MALTHASSADSAATLPPQSPLQQTLARLLLRLDASQPPRNPAQLLQLSEALPQGSVSDWGLWLAEQPGAEKLYWRSRDGGQELAGLGFALQLQGEQARAWLAQPAQRSVPQGYWFSDFPGQGQDDRWPGFPSQLLLVPRIALERGAEGAVVRVTCAEDERDTLRHSLSQLLQHQAQPSAPPASPLPPVWRQDTPGRVAWESELAAAQHAFATGQLQKVVLARRTRLDAAAPLPFWALFLRWREQARNGYQVALQLESERGFISFTPERLLRRHAQQLATEALAGTLPLAAATTDDAKNSFEHALVVEDLRAKLARCCTQLQEDAAVRLIQQPRFQHLYYAFAGQLQAGCDDAQLLQHLHPTAAIGGLPSAAAAAFIAQHEPFPRGWFAGVCGPVSAAHSELAVGIRSARVEGCRVELYAGAGIVPDSEAAAEWQELEQKIALPLGLFPQVLPAAAGDA